MNPQSSSPPSQEGSPRAGFPTGKPELRFGLALLVTGVLLWDFLLFGEFNLGFALGAIAVLACSAGYLLASGCRPDWYSGSLLVFAMLIAGGFARSDDGFIKYVMLHFLLLAANLGLCLLAGQNRYEPGSLHSLLDAPRILFSLGFGGMGASARGLREAGAGTGTLGKRSGAVALGLVIALPVLIVMVFLLMRADAAFEGLMDLLPSANWQAYLEVLLCGGFCAWLLYSRTLSLRYGAPPVEKEKKGRNIPLLTVNTVLAAVCLMYGVYLISQLAYLSGGLSGILPREYTLAQYARRGFFEMAWLCALNLGILLFAVRRSGAAGTGGGASRWLCLFIGLVTVFFVVAASAKMGMYIGSYGLTCLRFLTEVIMIFLGLSTVLVCLRLFLPKLPCMQIVVLLALFMGSGVFWADMTTQVARYNLHAYRSGTLESVDISYLSRLGSGAVPVLVELADEGYPEALDAAADYRNFYPAEDFREWNLSRARSQEALSGLFPSSPGEAAEVIPQ